MHVVPQACLATDPHLRRRWSSLSSRRKECPDDDGVVSHEEWLGAREQLLAKEKELVRLRDRVNADRRRLPMVRIDKPYTFEGPDGEVGLLDLFEGHSQLVMHHFMWAFDVDADGERAPARHRLHQLLVRRRPHPRHAATTARRAASSGWLVWTSAGRTCPSVALSSDRMPEFSTLLRLTVGSGSDARSRFARSYPQDRPRGLTRVTGP